MNLKKIALVFFLLMVAGSYALAATPPQDKARDQALIDAVEKGDRQKVLELLRQGANVNASGINDTVLETAIFQQDVEMVALLLDKGAKIKPDDLGNAAHGTQGDKAKATRIVRLLLDKGADLGACAEHASGIEEEPSGEPGDHCTKSAGENALRAAATKNNLDVMRQLLAKGVPVNGKDRFGDSVLMTVVGSDSIDGVRLLLEAGADVKAANDRGETVLMQAALADRRSDVNLRIRLLKSLLDRGADPGAKDKEGQTALHFAVRQVMSESGGFLARAEIAQLLLESGISVNAQDNRGHTALMNFVQSWQAPIEIVRLLLEKGADVNLQDQEGATVLMLAVDKGRVDIARVLLEKGAPIDARDKLGRTAIVHGAEAGEPDVVELLASKGADISLTEYKTFDQLKVALQNFALLKAVTYRRNDDVKTQLERGADVNARNRSGATALTLAAEFNYGDDTIIELLLAKGADVNATDDRGDTALTVSAVRNGYQEIKLLLDHKADVNVINKDHNTALLLTAAGGYSQIAELLLAKGADVRAKDGEGRTALLLACNSDHAQDELVRLLLAKGADASARDQSGNTALILAARWGAFQVIESLSHGGVDVNAKNKDGWTALWQVKESKETWTKQSWAASTRTAVIKLLEKAGAKE